MSFLQSSLHVWVLKEGRPQLWVALDPMRAVRHCLYGNISGSTWLLLHMGYYFFYYSAIDVPIFLATAAGRFGGMTDIRLSSILVPKKYLWNHILYIGSQYKYSQIPSTSTECIEPLICWAIRYSKYRNTREGTQVSK